MAKGLRSKCMRKNRSLIRKIVSEPIIKKRQEKITEAIKKDLELKKNGSLTNLIKILASKQKKTNLKDKNGNNTNDNNDDDMNNNEIQEDDDDEEEDKVVQGENIAKYTGSKLTSIKLNKTKYAGSKPRNNPGKELEWFK